jgi:hypothetical protein
LFKNDEHVETTYVGTVGSAHKFLANNSFVLSTPDTPNFPKREINLGYVTNLEYLDGTVAKKTISTDKTWTVKGSKGDSYIVTRQNNLIQCSCVGFQFRRKCKHIDMVEK